MTRLVLLFIVSYIAILPSKSIAEVVLSPEVKSLKDHTEIGVTVSDLHSDATRNGLTKKNILTKVELRLRQAGVKINSPANGWVSISVNVIALEDGLCVYSTGVDFSQLAALYRNNEMMTTSTWNKSALGWTSCRILSSKVLGSIDNTLDYFLNDYLKANPIKR